MNSAGKSAGKSVQWRKFLIDFIVIGFFWCNWLIQAIFIDVIYNFNFIRIIIQ